jgi:hypothetical protein
MRKILTKYLPASMLLAFLAMILLTFGGCGGDGGGSVSDTTPSPTPSDKSVVITGTVPGTVAIAYDYATGMEADRNVASGTPKRFTLNLEPGGYYLMFLENEGTPTQSGYAFYNVTGGNVFTFEANTSLDLGALDFNGYPRTATPQIDPISGNENVTETFVPEASFSPGDGKWTATRTFVNSTCSGHSPGTTVTENVTIAHGFGLVTYTPDGTDETAGGSANVNTAILTSSNSALETIYLTMQSDGSLSGSFSRVGYSGGCSEEGTITAVLGTSPPPAATLTGLTINGPSSMSEYGTATYTAMASWSDGSTTSVSPTWSVSPQVAGISTDGVLICNGVVASDLTVTISATYSYGGIAWADSMSVTITNVPTIPFTNEELSGKAFFQEYSEGGSYASFLYVLNADFSLELYTTIGPSYYTTGNWSNDPDGLFLDWRIVDFGPYTVERISDSSTEMEVAIHEMVWGNPHVFYATWEKTVPVDPAKLPGTYMGSDGYTWVFNADGTGTVSIYGGITFTWSADSDGVLRMPSSTGYTAVFYPRATSQSTVTEYTILKVGFAELTSTGTFFKYYGGLELTRQ